MTIDYKLDKSNAVKVHELFPEACRRALDSARRVEINYQVPRDVLIIGMGGSAIGGDLLKEWLPDIDISVSRSYDIPSWANKHTLVIASSYSGNTAETLSALDMALEKECMIVGLSSGGKLEKKSKDKFPLVSLPTGYQPRYAISHSFFSLVGILEKTGLISKSMETDTALNELQAFRDELKHTTSTAKNPAKDLAKKIGNKIPLIYSSEPLNSVGLRMKAEFNENSKVPSFSNSFPELNHNEIMGWASDLSKNFFSIFLRHQFESDEISKRITFTKNLIKKKTDIYEFQAKGTTKLSQMMTTLYFGDFTSIYLALINGLDPTPVKEIEALKKYLSK
ncbi:bifunctional phosphoglucose/phosphomannose isomerase [Candidatus Undinarchaeota archaeon]